MTRRSGRRKKAPQSVNDFRRSMVQVKIGNRTYDAIHAPGCQTCQHPARMLIEEKILQNYSFRLIAQQLSDQQIPGPNGQPMTLPKVSYQSIYNHFKNGHMPLEAATLRRLAEKRAQAIGSQYEEQAEQFVDHVVLSEAIIQRTYERMVSGEIEPDVRDGLAAAKMVHDVEASTQQGLTNEAWSEAMTVYFDEARQLMDEETWGRFTAALRVNPVLAAIERRLNPDPTVIDAEPPAIESRSRSA
jgi:hypothetical protein